MINYGIIGCGMMGHEHLNNIKLLAGTNISVIFEPNKDMAQSALKVAPEAVFADNLEGLLEFSDLDCLVIASPNHCHLPQLRKIAEMRNLPILVEKPLFTAVEDKEIILNFARDYKSPVWVAMEYRYMPPISSFMDAVEAVTGGIKMLTIREHRFPFLRKVGDWNRFNINSGGTFVEKCCHFFDLMRLVSNSEAVSVYASGAQDVNHLNEQYNGRKPDIIDNAFVIVNFENGIRSMLDLCMFSENSKLQEELCAVGNVGKIETGVPSFLSGKSSSELSISLRKLDNIKIENIEVDETILKAGHHHGSTYYEHLEFQKAITENLRPQVSLDDGLKAVAIGQAAELSIVEKRVVYMNEILED